MSKGSHENNDLTELKNRLEIIETQIKIAKAKKELSSVSSEVPKHELFSSSDLEKIQETKIALKNAIVSEAIHIGLTLPSSIDLDRFSQEWVEKNWLNGILEISANESGLPKAVVDRAVKSVLLEGIEAHETREELFEIRRKSSLPMPYHLHVLKKKFKNIRDKFSIWRYASAMKRLKNREIPSRETDYREKIRKKSERISNREEYLKQRNDSHRSYPPSRKAAEIRATRIQHKIQQVISSTSFIFTGASAGFMFLMLAIGGMKLFSAVESGFGVNIVIESHRDLEDRHVLLRAGDVSLLKAQDNHDPGEGHTSGKRAQEDNEKTHDGAHKAMSDSLTALEIILVAPLPYLLVLGLSRYIKALAFQEQADEFRRELLEFKAFEVALFIAIIAASVVGKALSGQLDLIFSGSVTMIITVLAAYYYIIEKAAKEAAEQEVKIKGDNRD